MFSIAPFLIVCFMSLTFQPVVFGHFAPLRLFVVDGVSILFDSIVCSYVNVSLLACVPSGLETGPLLSVFLSSFFIFQSIEGIFPVCFCVLSFFSVSSLCVLFYSRARRHDSLAGAAGGKCSEGVGCGIARVGVPVVEGDRSGPCKLSQPPR